MRAFCLAMTTLLILSFARAQSIADQKETVAFVFGTTHPLNRDKTVIKDPLGHRAELKGALGTGFFVGYPDVRLTPRLYGYFVTAKHVLRDFDGTFLPSIRLRINVNDTSADPAFDFLDLPVTDSKGNLLWLHSGNDADDVVATPIAVDQSKFAMKVIPLDMFVDDATLKTSAVEEGDSLYFIGLMAQYYGAKRNFPVIRRGTLALMTDEKIATPTGEQQAFIAELQSWPGNSGSPVFLSLGGLRGSSLMLGQKLNLLGILAGGFLNELPFDLVTGAQQVSLGNDASVGVSYIVPAMRITELLKSGPAQAERELGIWRMMHATQRRR